MKLIPDISQELSWIEKRPHALKEIYRGLERETLRVKPNGRLVTTKHPKSLGSALTHRWITTDFAESLLEFITPVDGNIEHMLTIMRDIHRYTARNLGNEHMWPFSMPCYIEQGQDIELAQYGTSNIGRLKTLYREGLKNRYGALMQIISGVHYNFSLPMTFWKEKYFNADKNVISSDYLRLIRNYYRFGWVIPYLFGTSPAICSSFLQGKLSSLPFEKTDSGMYYLPYSTSLRLSNHCINTSINNQSNLGITFNTLHEYISGVKRAIKTPSKVYQKIGLKKNGKRLQINTNVLQVESELYTPIRPKQISRRDETLLDALERRGVEYIEVRSLDINSFSPIGIDEQQIRFLDLFMLWCLMAEAPEMNSYDLLRIHKDWNRVILQGRKPGLMLRIGCETAQHSLQKIGKDLFCDLKYVAQTLDSVYGDKKYQKVCEELVICFDDPEQTFSARILQSMIEQGIIKTGCTLAVKYIDILQREPLEILNEADFSKERKDSIMRQCEIELSDNETFEVFLSKQNR